MTSPRGIRNNNPGNIRFIVGATSGYLGCTGSDGAFCQFDVPEHGIRALAALLLTYQRRYGIKTIAAVVRRWAPPTENDTAAYVEAVSRATGYDAETPLDFADPGVLTGLAKAIIQHENGQMPYTPEQLAAGIGAALGIRAQDAQVSPAPAPLQAPEGPAAAPAVPPAIPVPTERRMPIAALIAAFGPVLANLIPQVAKLFQPGTEVAQRNLAAGSAVFNAVVQAAGAPNIQAAIEQMQGSAEVVQRVTQAVVTNPEIMGLLEIGGGVVAAREAAVQMQDAERGFWRNPAFWVSMVLLALPFMLLTDALFIHPEGYTGELRAQIVTGVLAVVMMVGGFWLGSSLGSQRKTELAARAAP